MSTCVTRTTRRDAEPLMPSRKGITDGRKQRTAPEIGTIECGRTAYVLCASRCGILQMHDFSALTTERKSLAHRKIAQHDGDGGDGLARLPPNKRI